MRFIVSLLIAIGLIVLVFVLILKSFSSHNATVLPKPLTSYSNSNITMDMVISGPIVYDQNHQSVEVVVGQSQNQINVFQSYQNTVIKTKIYPNNQAAYLSFLSALDAAGYTKGTSNSQSSSTYGLCPFGTHYNFQIMNGNTTIQNYWTDTCADKQSTFKGSVLSVTKLFINQIPDYQSVTRNINL